MFAARLREAAATARDFARSFVEQPLPDPVVFRVRLNSSYDGDPRVGDEIVFPEDGSFERAEPLAACDEQQVLEALWRAGRVPEWIDVSVIGETGTATKVQLLCCGRFTAQDDLLYHAHEGRPPFHVTSPVLPIGHEDGQRFSLYHRSECWTLEEVARMTGQARDVWLLDLVGRASDDAVLASLPALPRLAILELKASPLCGSGVVELTRFPQLRVLRISLQPTGVFRIPQLPLPLAALEILDLHDPPLRPWGFRELVERAPNLSWLTLGARDDLFVDGACPLGVDYLCVSAKRLAAGLELPRTIDAIRARLSEMGDDEVDAWLSRTRRIRSLDLGGTPITDAFAETLPRRFKLAQLGLADTRVSRAAVERIRRAHPKLKVTAPAR